MSMKCEKLHNLLQNYYDGEIFLCIDFLNGRAIYTRTGIDKKCIISSKIFESYSIELIFTVIVVKGWLLWVWHFQEEMCINVRGTEENVNLI